MGIADRTYARVETALKGFLRIMPPEQTHPLFSGDPGFATSALDVSQAGLSEPLVHFMHSMDSKLNTILGLLSQRFLQEDFPSRILIHDISGSGLRFSSADDFAVGTVVEVVVALSSFPPRLAGTQGVIIRKETENDTVFWVLEFQDLREMEREKIIQFVISEQREQLRDRRSQG